MILLVFQLFSLIKNRFVFIIFHKKTVCGVFCKTTENLKKIDETIIKDYSLDILLNLEGIDFDHNDVKIYTRKFQETLLIGCIAANVSRSR